MRRFAASLSVVVVLLGLGAAAGGGTAAQDATPAAEATHPIVGAWRWQNPPGSPVEVTYAIFHADGTYQEVVGQDVGLGAWRLTGDNTADVTNIYEDSDPFDPAFNPGTVIVRQAVAVELRAPDGSVLAQLPPSGVTTGTRIEAGPMPAFAGPPAGTPAP